MEREMLQLLPSLLQARFAIFVEEEPGIFEACRHDPLIARPDAALRVVGAIHHRDEARQQHASRLQRKGALMVPQAGDQHLTREGQESRLEPAHHRTWNLANRRQTIQQILILNQFATETLRRRLELILDSLTTLFEPHDDLTSGHLSTVVGDASDGEGTRREHRMAGRLNPGLDIEDATGHHLAIAQRHDAVNGSHPRSLTDTPTHGLGPAEPLDEGRHQLR